ncbi:uncharacterized protein K452DRAFT_291161 [Aplosporella prunicola CBS 121167]|uniref:ABM domain-containing protein n=1 Tax=Aplosporella prunicola CBS 121167 TaxID=1176127 RepID=A0A6A6B2S0_9PEZI|nr:uncharacterized protein K452DRAFT_291161 [Aplosporella prunicola CBS 121167]KAF2138116.1 hypothetical protein K452DRAFT_291161 [Aplosporella prunicola CBS 121167]
MSEEIICTAVISPKVDKVDEVEKILTTFTAWVHAFEPDTLKYQLLKQITGETPEFIMHERYKSQAAIEAHESSETFQKAAGQLKDLLARPLSIYWSRPVAGFENRDRGTLHM